MVDVRNLSMAVRMKSAWLRDWLVVDTMVSKVVDVGNFRAVGLVMSLPVSDCLAA